MVDAEMTAAAAAAPATAGTSSAAARVSASQWSAIAAAALGALVLLGWIADIPRLRSFLPGAVQMKANTAIVILLAAAALYCRAARISTGHQLIARWSACAAALIGAATLGEYVFGWRLGIDEGLFLDHDAAFNSIRGRMSPYSAGGFIAIGAALAVRPRPGLRWLITGGAISIAAIGAASILGYTWNASELTTDQVLPPVAVNTALAFLLLGIGTLLMLRAKFSVAAVDAARRGAVETKVLIVFVGALLLLYAAGGITYRTGVSFANSAQWVTHTQQVRAALGELHATISDADSARRNYLLTGSPESESEFGRLSSELSGDIAALRARFAKDEAQLARLHELDLAVAGLTRNPPGSAGAGRPAAVETAMISMRQIRGTIRRMDDAEAGALAARAAELARDRSLTLYALMATLAIATAALILLFRSITRDIRERARNAIALSHAQREAQRATLAKSEFLAAMTHEIRTPMNGVIGMVDVLLHSSLLQPQVEMANLIRESADSLLTIIDDILDFSKIEAGRLECERLPLSIAAVLEKTCSFLDPLAARRDGCLEVYADPALPASVLGDASRLRQVLVNLIGNAIKFCSGLTRQGRVSVRALLAESHPDRVVVEFQVRDNGIGMDEGTLKKVFASFTQADASTTRKYGGTGLGLAISRQLAQLMGGEISVASSPDAGSTFTLRLAFAPAASASGAADRPDITGVSCRFMGGTLDRVEDLASYLRSDAALVAHDGSGAQVTIWVVDAGEDTPGTAALAAAVQALPDPAFCIILLVFGRGRVLPPDMDGLIVVDGNALTRRRLRTAVSVAAGRPSEDPASHPSARASQSPPPTREEAIRQHTLILVAEDNEINQLVIRHQLHLLGYEADVADDGRQALRQWEGGGYALLLTDVHMPEMDGYDLARNIRLREAGGSHIPIVALTANSGAEELERCRGAGMDDHLSKPVGLNDLRAILERWLSTRAALPASIADAPMSDRAGAPLPAA